MSSNHPTQKVRFDMCPTIYLSDETTDCPYYTKFEIHFFEEMAMEALDPLCKKNNGESRRGLEHLTQLGRLRTSNNRRRSIKAVLDAQGSCDGDAKTLAKIYKESIRKDCLVEAQKLANADALEASKIFMDAYYTQPLKDSSSKKGKKKKRSSDSSTISSLSHVSDRASDWQNLGDLNYLFSHEKANDPHRDNGLMAIFTSKNPETAANGLLQRFTRNLNRKASGVPANIVCAKKA